MGLIYLGTAILAFLAGMAPISASAGSALEKFVAGMPAGSWRVLPASSIKSVLISNAEARRLNIYGVTGPPSVIDTWNGAAFDGENWYFHGGGHANYGGNEIYAFSFKTLRWRLVAPPSRYPVPNRENPCPLMPDRTPLSSHTWDGLVYLKGKLWLFQGSRYCQIGWGEAYTRMFLWAFDLKSGRWQRFPRDPLPSFAMTGADPKTGRIALISGQYSMWINADGTYEPGSQQRYQGGWVEAGNATLDVDGRTAWGVAVSIGLFRAKLAPQTVGPLVSVVARKNLPPGVGPPSGIVFHAPSKRLVFWDGKRELVTYDTIGRNWARIRPSGPAPSVAKSVGVYSKWIYLRAHGVFAGYNNVHEGVWLFKPAANSPLAQSPRAAG